MQQPLRTPTERTQGARCGTDGCLEMRHTKRKGWGLFARVAIPAGTVVLREEPLAAIRTLTLTVGGAPEIARALETLAPAGSPDKTVHESLADRLLDLGANRAWFQAFCSRAGKRVTVRDLAIAVCEANAFSLTTTFTATPFLYVLYDIGSILNHSCEPNTMRFAPGTVSAEAVHRTLRDVPAGKEVTVTYLVAMDEVTHRSTRQASTKIHSEFVCRCRRCEREAKQPPPERQAVPHQVVWLMQQAKTAQRACQFKDAWTFYWQVLTELSEGARRLSQGNRTNLLLGASCCGVAQDEPDRVRMEVILRKLQGMCRPGGPTYRMTVARRNLVESVTVKKLPKAVAAWQVCLQHLNALHGDDNVCLDMDYLTCPPVRQITACVKEATA